MAKTTKRPRDDDDDDRDDEDSSAKKKAKKSKEGGGSMLFVILGVVGVLSLCCICGGVGGAGWIFGWFGKGKEDTKVAAKTDKEKTETEKTKTETEKTEKTEKTKTGGDLGTDKTKDKDKTKGPGPKSKVNPLLFSQVRKGMALNDAEKILGLGMPVAGKNLAIAMQFPQVKDLKLAQPRSQLYQWVNGNEYYFIFIDTTQNVSDKLGPLVK